MREKIKITIYGAEQICASCVGAPGSIDTYEWLQAAIGRKYETDAITYEYVDINEPQTEKKHQDFVQQIIEEDLFWPIVFVNEDLVAEGIPRLKTIYQSLEEKGLMG
ncbi:YuzD family protein [Oceanobacillus alkalisoli]|uniref:YuzD family protein n=1 Tax=Oceanobacillus alkalisoli TaxID=2925113 RepID=UPI001EF02D71|nr:YuzD family protein [Oceanobacillus alkalisoli]MCF3943264.1 YuzD family protein [Oceanobacillus alkalisoli]MCG5103859.1 YuzD family protein [Oceanobacillus alkalisoli]